MDLLGHRGAAGPDHPENTLAAVGRALDDGADGVEVDVRLSADGTVVCSHDRDLRRTAGIARDVSTLTDAELARVDLGRGHGLPTLAQVVDLVGDRGRLVVEVKTSAWPRGSGDATAQAVVEQLRRTRPRDVVVSSFDRERLRAVRAAGVPVPTGLLSRAGVPMALALWRAVQGGHDQVHVHVRSLLARPDLVAGAHRRGLQVVGWTARPHELLRLRAAGVDAVICDDPLAARSVLSGRLRATG